jgi:hypothetical protein
MNSGSAGAGQLFWHEQGIKPAYFRDRSVGFDVQHDGNDHQYAIEFIPTRPVTGVRLDPSRSEGTIRLSNIRLTTPSGEVLHRWTP